MKRDRFKQEQIVGRSCASRKMTAQPILARTRPLAGRIQAVDTMSERRRHDLGMTGDITGSCAYRQQGQELWGRGRPVSVLRRILVVGARSGEGPFTS
jgi:hypothetical protein